MQVYVWFGLVSDEFQWVVTPICCCIGTPQHSGTPDFGPPVIDWRDLEEPGSAEDL